MPASNTCWGIEMGAGAVKAIKLQRDGDDLKVLEFAVIPHKKVLSTPDLDQNEATRVAIGQLVSQFDLTGAAIAISVPGHSAFARFAKLPPVEPKKIPDIVKFEAVQQIPFPIDQVEWDYQTFTSTDSPDVEVGIFAITRDRIMERLAMWHDVGVTPDYVTLGPIAVYNSLAFDQAFGPQTPGTVILDVGATSTDLIVCEPGRVWVRTFPIGGHNFTQALVDAFKLSYSKAETLKRQAEQSKHARHVFQAMRPVFADLAQDVQRSIGYYQSSHRDANLTRLIGLGSTFQLPGLRKYLSQQLQMEVVRLEGFNKLTVDGPAAGEFQAATLNLATAYGLALQGLGFEHGIMANLMPVPVVREALWKRKTKWFAIAAGLSVLGGALAFVKPIADRTEMSGKPKSDVISTVSNEIRELKAEWKAVEETFKPDHQAANVAGLLDSRDVHAHLVNDLGVMLSVANAEAAKVPAPSTPKPAAPVPAGAAPTAPGGAPAPAIAAAAVQAAPVGFAFREFRTDFAPADADPNAPAVEGAGAGAVKGGQRVGVVLEVQTTRSDWERLVVSTFRKWLEDNAKRDGTAVPYEIKNARHQLANRTVIEAADNPASPNPSTPSGGASPVGSSLGGGRMAGRGGFPAPVPGGGPGYGEPAPEASVPQAGAEDVERMAPLPKPPPTGAPGDTVYTIRITWDAVVKGAAPAEPAEGQDPAAAPGGTP